MSPLFSVCRSDCVSGVESGGCSLRDSHKDLQKANSYFQAILLHSSIHRDSLELKRKVERKREEREFQRCFKQESLNFAKEKEKAPSVSSFETHLTFCDDRRKKTPTNCFLRLLSKKNIKKWNKQRKPKTKRASFSFNPRERVFEKGQNQFSSTKSKGEMFLKEFPNWKFFPWMKILREFRFQSSPKQRQGVRHGFIQNSPDFSQNVLFFFDSFTSRKNTQTKKEKPILSKKGNKSHIAFFFLFCLKSFLGPSLFCVWWKQWPTPHAMRTLKLSLRFSKERENLVRISFLCFLFFCFLFSFFFFFFLFLKNHSSPPAKVCDDRCESEHFGRNCLQCKGPWAEHSDHNCAFSPRRGDRGDFSADHQSFCDEDCRGYHYRDCNICCRPFGDHFSGHFCDSELEKRGDFSEFGHQVKPAKREWWKKRRGEWERGQRGRETSFSQQTNNFI